MAILCIAGVQAANYTVTGTVLSEQNEPEAYATLRIFNANDSVKAVALGVVGEDGTFTLDVPRTGDYRLNVTSVGKTPANRLFAVQSATTNLGEIIIKENAELLGEIEVTAMRPLVSKEIDRIGYDVQADEDSKTSSMRDILRKVPMVTVDADGTIKVKGSSNFKIYKNGKPNNALNSNSKEIFAAIPASMIKKVEVITDPGAREDAEGVSAILNIVTNESSDIVGIMGSVTARATYNNAPMGSLWLTGNLGKVNLSANGGYFHQGPNLMRSSSETDYTFVDSGNRRLNKSSNRNSADGGFWGIDASYDLDSLNLFTLEFNGFAYNADNRSYSSSSMFAPDGNPIYSYKTTTLTPSSTLLSFSGNLSYQHLTRRKGEVITLLYQISNDLNKARSEATYSELLNFPAAYSGINSNTRQHFLGHTAQADWERPLAEHSKLSLGGKFINRNNHAKSLFDYVGADKQTTDFTHTTTVAAGYADYHLTLGQWSARAGLRYEYSHLGAKFDDGSRPDFGSSLNDWVPNVSAMYAIDEANTLKLAYSTRISRPSIEELDPSVTNTPNSSSFGNPDLKSTTTQSVELNYSLIKQTFNINFSTTYSYCNNDVVSFTTVDPATDIITTTYGNIGRNHTVDFSLFGQFTLSPSTSFMINAGADYTSMRIPEIRNRHWGYNAFARVSQMLPWKLRLEAMLFFDSQSLESINTYNDNGSRAINYMLGLQRSFLKGDRLTVKILALNPFLKDRQWVTRTNKGDYLGLSTTTMSGMQQVGLEISFRFGSVRSQVKRVNTSINNDDIQQSKAPSSGSFSGM